MVHICICGRRTKKSSIKCECANPKTVKFRVLENKNSLIERRLQYALRYLPIDFKPHVMIKGVEVDIYIEKYKICVFADGPDHFKMPRDKRKNPRKKDAEDNERLIAKPNPHKVERFNTNDVTKNLRTSIFRIIERHPLKLKIRYRKIIRDDYGKWPGHGLKVLRVLTELVEVDKNKRGRKAQPYIDCVKAIKDLGP